MNSKKFKRGSLGLCLVVVGLMLSGCGNNPNAAVSTATALPAMVAAVPTAAPTSTLAPVVMATAVAPTIIAVSTNAAPVATNASDPANVATADTSKVPVEVKDAYQAALTDLTKRTNLAATNVQLTRHTVQEFSDSGLGCSEAGSMYMQVITPGYVMTLEASGKTYEYHTDMTGRRVVLCGADGQPVKKLP